MVNLYGYGQSVRLMMVKIMVGDEMVNEMMVKWLMILDLMATSNEKNAFW